MILAAVVACAPGGPRWEQSCDECHDPCKRERWGCDAETAEPAVLVSPCPYCEGRRPECSLCRGTNAVALHRCPGALVSSREIDAIRAVFAVEHGVLPDAGGWMDQAATFVDSYPLIARLIAHWREVAIKEAERGRSRR